MLPCQNEKWAEGYGYPCHPFLLENEVWKDINNGLAVGDRITVPRSYRFNLPEKDISDNEIKMIALLIAEGGITQDYLFQRGSVHSGFCGKRNSRVRAILKAKWQI